MGTLQDASSPMTSTASEAIAASQVRCEDEPIRVPGAIQQHGFLLVLDAELDQVLAASENAERFLHLPLNLILGSQVEMLLERELLSGLRLLQLRPQPETERDATFLGSYRVAGQFFSVVSHPTGGGRLLEFELQDRLVGSEMMNGVITNFVGRLSRLESQRELCDALTRQVAELTGFDRVMLYSFDQEDHGTVLAEVNNGRLPSYLGLRFPASDIPKQARDLYLRNTVRIIPDAGYAPSPIRGVAGTNPAELDLSLSLLRSVSPTHLEYMRNMGTLSSMSVSLVTEGRLWGLIGAHHAEPKLVPYLVRSACDMLSKVGGTQLAGFETGARLRETVALHTVQRDLMTELAAEPDTLKGLRRLLPQLLEVTAAEGVALVVDDAVEIHGKVPARAAILRLAEGMADQPEMEFWSSAHLSAELPWTSAIAESGSGLLAVRISALQRRFLLWFRPELTMTVRWAGEPVKSVGGDEQLSPRHSFAEWKETVRGRSEPWTEVQIASARDFRAALKTVGLRRAEEAVELGEARFERLTQALPVRVFTADDAGRLTYTNERWQATGMRSTGRWFEQALLSPEDADRCAALWEQIVAENRNFEAEVRLRTAGEGGSPGPERWNFVRAVPFHRVGAERAGWIGCLVDLTESKEREMALRMNEKLALTGRMTNVIAHEINNPLEAITNLMYLLRTRDRHLRTGNELYRHGRE